MTSISTLIEETEARIASYISRRCRDQMRLLSARKDKTAEAKIAFAQMLAEEIRQGRHKA